MSYNQTWLSGVRRVDRPTAVEEVRARLIEVIESGSVLAGDRLPTEAELAAAFGVSRPVVREALGSLRALGLTETRAGRGTFVVSNYIKTPLALGSCSSSDLNEVRRYLEVPGARLSAMRRTEEEVAEMEQILRENAATDQPHRLVAYDSRFHIAVARASRNPLLPRLVSELRDLLEEQSLAVLAREDRLSRAMAEHAAVLAAIRAGDGEAAAAAMEAHLVSVEREVALLGAQRRHADET